MESTATLCIVSDKQRIKEGLISELEHALARAKDGDIEGFCLVILSDSVEKFGFFEDRLRMLGALHLSLYEVSDLEGSS